MKNHHPNALPLAGHLNYDASLKKPDPTNFGLKSLHDLPHLADFGEGRLEAEALAALEPPLPEDGLFGDRALITDPELPAEEESPEP